MTITIETVAKASKTDLVEYALARGLVRTKTEGSKLLKDALVCLISDRLSSEVAEAAQQAQEAPRTREERCSTEAPANGLSAPRESAEKNTKPPLTAAQRAAKRKKNRIKHRRALARRRH